MTLAIADIDALASLIGDKDFLMGDKPCAADATVFAFVASFLTPWFDTPLLAAAVRHANLAAYRDRITALYFSKSEALPLPREKRRLTGAGQGFRFQPISKNCPKVLLTERAFRVPTHARFQDRQ